MVAWHVADGSDATILGMRPCERLQISGSQRDQYADARRTQRAAP